MNFRRVSIYSPCRITQIPEYWLLSGVYKHRRKWIRFIGKLKATDVRSEEESTILEHFKFRKRMERNGSARRSNYIFEYRIAVLGSSRAGKTSLIKRFIDEEFEEIHVPTIEDHFQHVVNLQCSTCVCLLMDTSGTFEFPAMKNWTISKANAFVVVYSVTDKKSFEQAKALVHDIKCVKTDGTDVKIVLIGNKTDLAGKRRVPKETGQAFAKDVSCDNLTCELIETSSKEDSNVSNAFHCLLKMFLSEQVVDEDNNMITPHEKRQGSFSRTLSLRKSHKERKAKSRQKNTKKQTLMMRSDENLLDIDKPMPRLRSHSLDTDEILLESSSDSDSNSSSPNEAYRKSSDKHALKQFKRQNSAKELLRRTTSACKEKLDQAKRRLHRSQKLAKENSNTPAALQIANS